MQKLQTCPVLHRISPFILCLLFILFPLENLSYAAPLNLSTVIAIAQSKSPDIQALENQYDSASAKTRLALAPSEPTFVLTFNDLTQALHLNTTSSTVLQINQNIGFPGRAFLNRAALDDQSQAIHAQLKSMKIQVALNVKQAYYGLALAQYNLKLNADQTAAYERILATAKRRYEAGQTSQVDYINAQVALLSNENDLSDLESSEKVARAQLNVYLKNPPETLLDVKPIEMIYHPPIQLGDSYIKMTENRPEIKAAKYLASASDKAYKLAWMSLLPDFQAFAGTTFYNQATASPLSNLPNYATHTYLMGIQFTIPIWFLLNEREMIVGASHDRGAADANLDGVFNQSKITLESTAAQSNALRIKIEKYEKHLLPLSDQSLNLALTSYSSGKVDFLTLADTALARRGVRRDYAAAVVNYHLNYAAYGQLIGEEL